MNRWKQVWNNRPDNIKVSEDVFDIYVQLKKAEGFDIQMEEGYYEGLFDQWKHMVDLLKNETGSVPDSVYEVCCGSGANLWLFYKLFGIKKLGGLDYSEPLIKIARSIMDLAELEIHEALDVNIEEKYDWVISDSAFQYFPDAEYGMKVFDRMLQKAERAVVVTEIHDQELKDEHIEYRKSKVEDYDRVYEGLDKTYYEKKRFEDMAGERGYKTRIIKPENEAYWNNRYVFDLFCWR